MDLKDLLVHVDSGPRTAERTRLALALARRHGARLTGLFAESSAIGASIVGRRSPQNVSRATEEARARFVAACSDAGVASRFWQVGRQEATELIDAVVVLCRRVDLAVFGQQRDDPAPTPDGLVERVIAECGRPVLVVPSAGSYPDAGRRVLVAWSGSREAARALHDALPILERAQSVTVLALQVPAAGASDQGLPSAELTDHLSTHGVTAAYDRWVIGDLPTVDAVLNRAFEEHADLTVLGAYGLGGGIGERSGTTRAILETMTTPVLLSC